LRVPETFAEERNAFTLALNRFFLDGEALPEKYRNTE